MHNKFTKNDSIFPHILGIFFIFFDESNNPRFKDILYHKNYNIPTQKKIYSDLFLLVFTLLRILIVTDDLLGLTRIYVIATVWKNEDSFVYQKQHHYSL